MTAKTEFLGPLKRRETLADRVYAATRTAIVERALPAGSPISEPGLARQLRVSRTPVREALRKLHEVGLVSVEPNGRVLVVSPSEQALREAYELREALEGMAAWLAAARSTPEEAAEVRRHAEASLEAASAGDETGFGEGDSHFHQQISEVARNESLARCLANARDLASVLRQIDSPAPGFSIECGRAHVAIAEAIEAGDVTKAESTMRSHIRSVLEHVLRSRGTSGRRKREAKAVADLGRSRPYEQLRRGQP
ncbi:MAG: GntR family transcriptional regulator [Vicinamibacteria bacterium]